MIRSFLLNDGLSFSLVHIRLTTIPIIKDSAESNKQVRQLIPEVTPSQNLVTLSYSYIQSVKNQVGSISTIIDTMPILSQRSKRASSYCKCFLCLRSAIIRQCSFMLFKVKQIGISRLARQQLKVKIHISRTFPVIWTLSETQQPTRSNTLLDLAMPSRKASEQNTIPELTIISQVSVEHIFQLTSTLLTNFKV